MSQAARGGVRRYTVHWLAAVSGALLAAVTVFAGPERGWRQAEPGRAIRLPADHASHPEYGLEWWYYSGNLDAREGRRFGYQLTFFRIGVDQQPENRSRWAVRDLFVAHFAITDVRRGKHMFAERMNRAGPGWAGAATDRYLVWNEDWRAALEPDGAHHLAAGDAQMALDLELRQERTAAMNGDHGYSQKGAQPGNASHYYSLTRMTTRGSLVVAGERIDVAGLSWMDHEFGTNFLEPEQRGWDWVALQLDDGRDLMIYQLRRNDGSVDPRSSGTLVEPDGNTVPIRFAPAGTSDRKSLSGFTLEPQRSWTSPITHAQYPVQWRLRIPQAGVDVEVQAALDEQELATTRSAGVSYWEGAVDARGLVRGHATRGRGYLEMTGYAGRPVGHLFSTFR